MAFTAKFKVECREALEANKKVILSNLPTVPLFPVSSKREDEIAGDDQVIHVDVTRRENQARDLAAIEQALLAMKNGTWGTCVDCGDEIAEKRLKANPFARKCIICAEGHDSTRDDRARTSYGAEA